VEKLNAEIVKLSDQLKDVETAVARPALGGSDSFRESLRISAAKFYTARNKKQVKPAANDLDVQGYLDYCDAFEAVVRGNLHAGGLTQDMRNALQVGSDPDGGYFVPPTISEEIERRIFDTSPIRQRARVITIGTGAWEAPYRIAKGISGGWVGERAARPATGTAQGGMQRIPVHEQYALPEVTQEMLDDSMIDVASMLQEETSDEMSRTENLAFVSGTGVAQPTGFLDYGAASVTTGDSARSWGVLQYVPTGAAGAFPDDGETPPTDIADSMVDTIAALHPIYRQGATWAMNRLTEAVVRKLKDRNGRYLVGFGDLRDAITGFSLFGFPIDSFEDMPAIAADSMSIAFANWRRGYYIIDRIGFRVLQDPFTNKPYVGFYITKRTGGDVRNFDAIKLVKFAAS
jgi:HK97 family phage major capsid protein